MRYALALALLALAAGPARAACNLRTAVWTAATGPVSGYEVEVKRDAAPYVWLADVTSGLSVAVSGAEGETVRVRVRAFATDATPRRVGAWSPESAAAVFCPPLGAPGAPTWSTGETSAVLTEPDVDLAGDPLGPGNPLWACVAWTPGRPAAWLDPARAVGGRHDVPWPATTAELPAEYRARCIYPAGWGPEALAVAAVWLR